MPDDLEFVVDSATDTAAAPRPGRDALDGARSTPGTLLEGWHRIMAPLGTGGMGEVHRADDVRLGQPVAPEFLRRPESRHSRFMSR